MSWVTMWGSCRGVDVFCFTLNFEVDVSCFTLNYAIGRSSVLVTSPTGEVGHGKYFYHKWLSFDQSMRYEPCSKAS